MYRDIPYIITHFEPVYQDFTIKRVKSKRIASYLAYHFSIVGRADDEGWAKAMASARRTTEGAMPIGNEAEYLAYSEQEIREVIPEFVAWLEANAANIAAYQSLAERCNAHRASKSHRFGGLFVAIFVGWSMSAGDLLLRSQISQSLNTQGQDAGSKVPWPCLSQPRNSGVAPALAQGC
jgi:hypothetical protein